MCYLFIGYPYLGADAREGLNGWSMCYLFTGYQYIGVDALEGFND